jgi:hypothetical protein
MSKLIGDVLYLVFEDLQDDRNALYSCLSVNKVWSKNIIPILWRNPWKYCLKAEKKKMLLDVIISHLSDETKNNLWNQGIVFFFTTYQRPLLNYISFCRHLSLNEIIWIIDTIYSIQDKFKATKFKNEIIKLFINENTKFSHLYIPHKFDYQIHLIPGAKSCFSEIEFISCNTNINDNILFELIEKCKSIKEMNLCVELYKNNYGIVKLVEVQKKLRNVRFINKSKNRDETFCMALEESLIEHGSNIQYFMINKQPITKILSYFINLKVLELDYCPFDTKSSWYCLENLSLPLLQVLKAKSVSVKALTSLIKNTSGYLVEIKIDYISHDDENNEKIIQTIYQKCPNLKYLKLLLRNSNILEFEKLLIKCQYLCGLYILISNVKDIDKLFEILTKSSPIDLFKFKFYYVRHLKLESLKLFFDNWKDRHPVLLQTIGINIDGMNNLVEKYKSEGVIKKYDNDYYGTIFSEFEWIQKKFY